MIKKFILVCFLAGSLISGLRAQSIDNEQADYDFAVNELEMNYAGFPRKTEGAKLEEYESKRDSLRNAVMNGEREGYDAVAELFAWFEDFHLTCGGWLTRTYMQRQLKSYEDECEYAPKTVTAKVDDNTFLIRFPSCGGVEPSEEWIENSVKEYLDSGCENLILDIRGNPGGSDRFITEYLELLSDRPGILPRAEIRNGQSNRDWMRAFSKKYHTWGNYYRKMKRHPDSTFICMRPDIKPFKLRHVSPLPKKAAVIIDGNVASVAEGLLLDLRFCSGRTRIYGRDNTLGCTDHCNSRIVQLPNSGVKFTVPMTRAYYFKDYNINIDDTGIAPDVRIDLPLPEKLTDNIDEWVRWVAEDMK